VAKQISCADVGAPDCDFKATGETVEEVMRKCGEHAAKAHGITELTPELATALQGAVRDV